MKLIAKTILMIYLFAGLSAIAYAGGVSAGINIINLNYGRVDLCAKEYLKLKHLSDNLGIKADLIKFIQDIPQIYEYDWNKVKEDNRKSDAFLREI